MEECKNDDNDKEDMDNTLADFGEGLKRMLSSLYGHTSSNVLSATMAKKLLSHGSRFKFSHEFMSISLKHLLQWITDEENLEFKLRKVKKNENDEYECVMDLFINNIIYRPVELEHLSCYELICQYELKKLEKKKVERLDFNVESETIFNLVEEHPSHKYMVMSRRKHLCIPCISSINLLPSVTDLSMNEENCDEHTLKLRENYGLIVLLLFYPYRTKDDLELEGSYWKRYKQALLENKMSTKCLEVCQNIQDVCHNCSKLKAARDELETTTVYESHEDDKKEQSPDEELNKISIDEISELFQQADDFGIREVHPSKRKLKIIANRHEIVNQDVLESKFTVSNITEIPEGLMSETKTQKASNFENDTGTDKTNNVMSYKMIIQILNDNVINDMPLYEESNKCLQMNTTNEESSISYKNIISKFTLDFKQSVAFEIMASSFILKSLQMHKVTQECIEIYFKNNEEEKSKCVNSLLRLKNAMKKKGGEKKLIMFLSGMGGTGKSEVVKAFVYFVENISYFFGWNYDSDTVKITALTGAAACQIPNGKTIHNQACLNSKKITQANVDCWKSTKMLIIDEISFMNEDTLEKLDKNLRLLKENDTLFGGIMIVLVGDFFQLLPLFGNPLFKCNTLQFSAINKAVFLNNSHRFEDDPEFGEIMRRLRNGLITKKDLQTINSRHITNPRVSLPPINQLRCACYMNTERNAYSNVIFLEHLKQTHQFTDDTSVECPKHTCIIKASMRSKENGKKVNNVMYNRLLDECGDSDIKNSKNAFVDIALKFFHNIPLMMNTNDRIKEKLANGTSCRGLYVKLKKGYDFVKENWEGYMVNTISVDHIEHVVCMIDDDKPKQKRKKSDNELKQKRRKNDDKPKQKRYFIVKPVSTLCSIRLKEWNNMSLENIKITYLPLNSSISTTGHKLQG